MKRGAKDLILSYLEKKFGSIIAENIMQKYLVKYRVHNIDALSEIDKINVGEHVILDVYGKFFSKEKLSALKTSFLLEFVMNEVYDDFSNKFKNVNINIEKLEMGEMTIDASKIGDEGYIFFENEGEEKKGDSKINDGDLFCLFFEFRGSFEGLLIVSISRKHLDSFFNDVLSVNNGNTSFEVVKTLLINFFESFFRMLIGRYYFLFKKNINFNSLSVDLFRKKYFSGDKLVLSNDSYLSRLKFSLGENKYDFDANFLKK